MSGFCADHWAALRGAVEKEGLTHLVPTNGVTAALQLAAEVEAGESTPASFDPLMGAHWAIVANVSELLRVPVILMDGCPLCIANTAHKEDCDIEGCEFTFDDWVDRAADDQHAKARDLGLIE